MRKFIFCTVATGLLSTGAYADTTSLNCIAKKGEIEITLNAKLSVFDGENKIGMIDRYDLLILGPTQAEFNGVEFKDHTSISDKNVSNLPYNGRKYKGYLKFDLNNYSSQDRTINGGVDNIEFIVSPKYKVIKTEASGNHWNRNWTWDIETREFDAVFPLNLDDHHGDYIQGKCYTKKIVNEVRG